MSAPRPKSDWTVATLGSTVAGVNAVRLRDVRALVEQRLHDPGVPTAGGNDLRAVVEHRANSGSDGPQAVGDNLCKRRQSAHARVSAYIVP
ncbi:hypothetical protein [Ideonella sp. YS5]|uniref:hypothetical protein n=1 Tax=Ideonella sp. YS5 TaxID=3453714 RepID=UPI003EEDB02F